MPECRTLRAVAARLKRGPAEAKAPLIGFCARGRNPMGDGGAAGVESHPGTGSDAATGAATEAAAGLPAGATPLPIRRWLAAKDH
ncbi:hypothetical protein J2S43_006998 [Catenuloplanes nepalensis]|uniref:Uncharacterized protein n=1 Tax=Catenuloplanes nepalensis TaxID=587533 RepID=A0ABT9N5G4_9ACTN|nr:hypothetical protein [Catenuloplanes nepalensis]